MGTDSGAAGFASFGGGGGGVGAATTNPSDVTGDVGAGEAGFASFGSGAGGVGAATTNPSDVTGGVGGTSVICPPGCGAGLAGSIGPDPLSGTGGQIPAGTLFLDLALVYPARSGDGVALQPLSEWCGRCHGCREVLTLGPESMPGGEFIFAFVRWTRVCGLERV